MELLQTVDVYMRGFQGKVEILKWTKGDPFPVFGKSVGVDTETELFSDTILAPPLVVTGVFDAHHNKCYMIGWQDTPYFIGALCKMDVQQRYFNLGYDELVLEKENLRENLIEAIEYGRVRDMQTRIHINDVATDGFVLWNHYSLENCARDILGVQLDKGHDNPEESARLTFKRNKEVTQEQYKYLLMDCATTWALGEKVPEQKTEIQHTKGMVVLAHISYNGFPVDPIVFDSFEKKLNQQKDEYRLRLLDFGFPDPYKKDFDENGYYRNLVRDQIKTFVLRTKGIDIEPTTSKPVLRWMLLYMYNFANEHLETEDFEDVVAYAAQLEKATLKKREKELYELMLEEYDITNFLGATKEIVMNALMGHIFEYLNKQIQENHTSEGYDLAGAIEYASDIIDANPHWLSSEKQPGPKTFLQNHISGILTAHPDLKLEKTEKSGDWKLTLKDMWRLEDLDIKDPFIENYTKYKHCEKYLSTYLNRENVKPDGRIHAKFTNYLRTGRTSCTSPNLQNLPSRDKQYPLKNMFCPPKGAILCATDFSFIELCAFAQTCYSRFGASVMMDVINAGLDPHRWFAGVMNKIIKPDLSKKDDPQWVAETKAFLKEKVPDSVRQFAKAANFGSEVNRFSYLSL